jgi:hypothetical protein
MKEEDPGRDRWIGDLGCLVCLLGALFLVPPFAIYGEVITMWKHLIIWQPFYRGPSLLELFVVIELGSVTIGIGLWMLYGRALFRKK